MRIFVLASMIYKYKDEKKNKAILRTGIMSDFLRLGVEMVVDGNVVKRRDGEGWPEERRPYHLVQHQVVGSSKSQKA